MPEHLWVTEVVVVVLDYRIAFVRGECLSSVMAVCYRLLLCGTGRGVYGNNGICSETGRVVLVAYC